MNKNFMNKNIYNLLTIPDILSGKKSIDKNLINVCDFEYMAQISYEQFILPFYYEAFNKHMDDKLSKLCLKEINKYIEKKKFQLKLLQMIKNEFKNNDIDYMLIKGFALAKTIYNSETKRYFGDLDIIIDLNDFKKANEIMKKIGFRNMLGNVDLPNITQLDCYEIEYEYGLCEDFFISVEIKIATSSVKDSELISHFKNNKIEMDINGDMYNTLNLNDTFILLCTNAYSNFEIEFANARLREMFDLYFFIVKYNEELNWKYILQITIQYKLTHQVFAILTLLNEYYENLISDQILNIFLIDNINYGKECFHNYSHGWMRDWNINKLDVMINNRKVRWQELFFALSLKSYSSRNLNFDNKIIVQNEETIDSDLNNSLLGIKSEKNEIEFTYAFSHNKNDILFKIDFNAFNHKNQIRTVLLIHDLDREMPRRMIEFYYENNIFKCRSLIGDLEYSVIESSQYGMKIAVSKSNFKALLNRGHLLCYRFYSVRKCGDIDFAINDDRKMFDFENPNVLYLDENYVSQIKDNIKEKGLFYKFY